MTAAAAGRADFSWITAPPIRAVMAALEKRGEARFVGGCVRDSLLGLTPRPLDPAAAGTTDIDVGTALTPDETTAALLAAGIDAHPTGIEHGTVTAVASGLPVEVTTLRADVATDGRHAEVAFTTDWEQDWRRRDFRINAMYLGTDGTLFDPAGGRDDLGARRVRFIGDPDERIAEDFLRILRFFRFTSRYAERPDPDGLAACARGAAGIERLSKERIWQETARLFATPAAPECLRAADRSGVLARVLDEEASVDQFARLHRYLDGAVPPALGLAATWPSADITTFRAAFKPSNAILSRVEAARAALSELVENDELALSRALYRHGRQAVTDAALLRAGGMKDGTAWFDLHARAAREPMPQLPVQGRDLVARGVQPGPQIGSALATIEAAWLAAGCPDAADTINQIVGEVLDGRG